MQDNAIALRPATESDLVAINDIYNHYVHHSTCTYQEEPEPLNSRRQWLSHHGGKHPVIVAETGGQVIGWGSLSAYHPRSAYRTRLKTRSMSITNITARHRLAAAAGLNRPRLQSRLSRHHCRH